MPIRALAPRSTPRDSALVGIALLGLLATFATMVAFDAAPSLGAIALAPWVGVIGFELGFLGGLGAGALAILLWQIAASASVGSGSAGQLAVRAAALLLLGAGGGLAGRQLRRSNRAHRSVSALQSALIDAALDGICLTDPQGNLLISNAPMRRLVAELGMPRVGTIPERLLAISDRMAEPERYRRRMIELAESKEQSTSDEFEVANTGRVFRGYTAPVTDAEGRYAGRVWTLREVTADRELDRMRDAFVATVSHELRTPLTSISGFLEMMQEEEDALGDAGRTYMEVIRRSAERLHQLVEDLLLVAQIEARRIELRLEPVDLAGLAERSLEAARPLAEEKEVSLELVADGPVTVQADARRVAQIVDNLVSNAVKFTRKDGSVRVHLEPDGDGVRLTVSDTGIGIPADEQGQVFSRFFRSSTASRLAIPGSGLGLAISRALVEQHGGTIGLESSEGQGTRVTVMLPFEP